jgi:hypothetical protein
MVFSDAKNIETDLTGADGFTGDGIADRRGEAVDPDLH